MKSGAHKKKVVFAAAGLCVVILVAVAFWRRAQEPEYQGKKLSEWMMYRDPQKRAVAVKSIGTKAIPILLRWIQEDDPARYAKRSALITKFPAPVTKIPLVATWAGQTKGGLQGRFMRSFGAVEVFRILGPEAQSAIPELTRMVKNSASENVVSRASLSLAYLGADALPPLFEALSNPRKRRSAAGAMCHTAYVGSNACPAIPLLVRYVSEGDLGAGDAQKALANFALDPACALKHKGLEFRVFGGAADPVLRSCVIRALEDFGTNATAGAGVQGRSKAEWAIGVAEKALGDSDASVRTAATNTFEKISKEMLANGMSHF